MDKNKHAQGQQNPRQQGHGSNDREWNETSSQSNTDRGPAEGRRSQNTSNRGDMGAQGRGTGTQGEKNSSAMSNRGMNRTEEQMDLPNRGSSDEDSSGQSER